MNARTKMKNIIPLKMRAETNACVEEEAVLASAIFAEKERQR